jgi:hypothetical protein
LASGNSETNVVHLDESNTNLDDLNAYFVQLQTDFAAAPSTHAAYSNMGPEGLPQLSGLEPAEVVAAVAARFPGLAEVQADADRYVVSADILEQDKDATWGMLHVNVRGHVDQGVLLSPDQLSRVQSTAAATAAADDARKLTASSTVKAAGTFNWGEAMVALYHAETCYCEEDTYMGRTFAGPLAGFVITSHLSNPRFDTAGYIGYHSTEQVIHVAFRGSASLNNWITTNLDVASTAYPRCDGCRVHSGFYDAALAILPDVLSEVQRLRGLFPAYKVVVTGHSLGGALSHLTALELEAANILNLELYTFGSPRVTNTEMAEYSSSKLPTASRVTHDKDLVVHTPGSVFYTHMAGEWHQPGDEVEVVECFGYEDESCSFQYIITSIDDHMEYLGVEMGEGGCAAVSYD